MSGDSWTDEKHLHFLSSLEASFLRSMFENKDRLRLHLHHLRLDRNLPDTCESTLDLKPPPSSSSSSSSHRRKSRDDRMDGRIGKRSRRVSSQPYDSATDQVVPQLEKRCSGEDEGDHPNVRPRTRQAAATN